MTSSRLLAAGAAGLLALALGTTAEAKPPDCTRGNRVSRTGRVKQLAVVGLTSTGRLVCFTDRAADRARDLGAVTGLGSADGALIGIDFRVQDGLLYGVGTGGGVYTIDPATAVATKTSQLTVALDPAAQFFGVDFNPAADRLRIVSDMGQNLRHNVNAGGTTIDDSAMTRLSYMPMTVATGVTGAAYTNNDLDANSGTTLFDLDTNLNQIAIQSPPNNGNLVATGKLTVDPDAPAGFDVFSALVGGATVSNHGFAALTVGGGAGFYRVDLLTGKATLVDPFATPVVDVAIPLPVPAP